jgi:hypothetical protein
MTVIATMAYWFIPMTFLLCSGAVLVKNIFNIRVKYFFKRKYFLVRAKIGLQNAQTGSFPAFFV